MGEPVETVIGGAIDRSYHIIKENEDFLEEDIEKLEELQDKISEMSLNAQEVSNGSLIRNSKSKSDTEKVINWYEDLHYSRQDELDLVNSKAEKLDISRPAAHFLQELLNIGNIDDRDAYRKINFLDSNNQMAPPQKDEVISLVEYPKANRRQLIERLEIYLESLENYQEELDKLDERIRALNQQNKLPMEIDESIESVHEFENMEERLKQLEKRRMHEVRRMPDLIEEYTINTIETYLDQEEYEDPIIYDINFMKEMMEEAVDNIRVK